MFDWEFEFFKSLFWKSRIFTRFQVKRKEIPEREIQLNNAVTCVGELDDQLDETTVENARGKVNDMKDRWGVVTQRLDDFCNRDIPVSVSRLVVIWFSIPVQCIRHVFCKCLSRKYCEIFQKVASLAMSCLSGQGQREEIFLFQSFKYFLGFKRFKCSLEISPLLNLYSVSYVFLETK